MSRYGRRLANKAHRNWRVALRAYVAPATMLAMGVKYLEVTPKMADILQIFLADVEEPHYGLELMQRTGQPSGSMYKNLAKFEQAGWLSGGREDIDPRAEGRPARRFYRLTGEGAEAACVQLAALSNRYRPPSPARPRLAFGGAR